MKKLYRSTSDKKLGGILGGLGEMLNVDVSILRIVYFLVTLFTGFFPFILIYLAAYFIIPEEGS